MSSTECHWNCLYFPSNDNKIRFKSEQVSSIYDRDCSNKKIPSQFWKSFSETSYKSPPHYLFS